MSHLFKCGYTVREAAWHANQTGCLTLDDYPGMDKAMELAGHNFDVVAQPLFRVVGTDNTPIPLSGFKALVRNDNNTVVSVMKDSYEVIQNKVPWSLIDQLFQQGAKWDTAGTLNGKYDQDNKEVKGQVYWCLALLDEPKTVKGDDSLTFPYIAATWSHDGTQSLRFRAMSVRIVCANTHHAAMFGNGGADLDVSIRHYGKLDQRISNAKEAIKLARTNHDAFLVAANELASMPVTNRGIDLFIEKIVPMPEAAVITDRVRNNVLKSRDKCLNIMNGTTIAPGIRNTAYGLVEMGVEFEDHIRKSLNQDIYFTRNVIKTSSRKLQLVQTAREIAMEMAV